MMTREQILSRLSPAYPWSSLLQYEDLVVSTNNQAKTMALSGAPEGTVLIADRQTGGRGRRGRSFHSPAGMGIYFSLLLRPNCPPDLLMHLTCAVAVAMCDATEKAAGFRPGIKWTNDLVSGGKKLAGILTELGLGSDGTVDYAVIGVGINCNQKPTDFPEEIREMAGSLAMVAGRPVDRCVMAAAMAEALYAMNRRLLTEKEQIMEQYRRDCITIGQEISLVRGETVRHGTAVDVDGSGALLVEFSPGLVEAVNSGEVSIRGLYGYV